MSLRPGTRKDNSPLDAFVNKQKIARGCLWVLSYVTAFIAGAWTVWFLFGSNDPNTWW